MTPDTALNNGHINEPVLPPAAWLEAEIVKQEQVVNNALAQVTATEVYQAYMREQGALNKLREWQQAAQASPEPPSPRR